MSQVKNAVHILEKIQAEVQDWIMHEILQTNNTLKRVKSNKLYIIKE
jgi:hypothetical protein